MATNYTSLLGFALPTTGELSGTWGDVVNQSITELVEDSIAGTATASVTSGDWTLTTTGAGAANEARNALLIPTGTPGASRNIIAPSASKAYIVDNQSNAAVVVKGSATTGATIAAGTTALVAWDGSDFVLVAQDLANAQGTLAVAKGGTGITSFGTGVATALGQNVTGSGGIALSTSPTFTTPNLGTPSAATLTNATELPIGAGTTGTLPVNRGGTGQTSLTANNVILGNGTSAVQVVAPGTSGNVLTSNGTTWTSAASPSPAEIKTPTNVSPADEATDIGETPTLEGSPYYSLYGKTQKSSQWQISTDPAFATTVYDSGEVLGVGVTHAVPAGNLLVSTTYYWRVRYRDIDNTYSGYSTPTEFVTAAGFNNFIPTPTATPAIGAALEGGFYTGLIWNQVTQSATSTAIGTGSKTFTVTDAAPLFYSGQAVEVRSRANPATQRMKGTVTASSGTTLTVNVTSVDGSGTYTDWSIMAKYRVIVAPKSSGENSSIAYKNANTAAPSETGTLTEGRKATLAMVAADTSTVYPAAHYCNNLSIGSYTDWYLPARDELELIWRNLKPTTDNNYTTADRPTGATPNYQNLGSLGDTANTHGLNNNSDPQGAAYTSTVPARTSVAAFQTGGAEAMAYGSQFYWSSTEYSTTLAWRQLYTSSLPGRQDDNVKGGTRYVRAVRRSII